MILFRFLLHAPPPLVTLFCRALGTFLYLFIPVRKKVIRQQMEKALGKAPGRLIRENYIHYAHIFVESLLLASLTDRDRAYFERSFRLVNDQALRHALAQKKGVFLLSLHLGYWEALGPILTFYFCPITVLIKRIKNPAVRRVREAMQAFPGVTLLDPTADTGRARSLLHAIGRREIVGIMHDQHRPGADFAPFFGFEARTNTTAAVLTRRTGAPILLTYILRKKFGDYEVHFRETQTPETAGMTPKEGVKAVNAYYNGLLETVIREHPEQWLWAHRRFKDNPAFDYS